MIFLSPRQWLARGPRALQLFVALLALLSVVAPSWHVCALGGHVFHSGGHEHEHGQPRFQVVANADGSPGPVICACAAREHEPVKGNAFASRTAHDHTTCLALLLQTMPSQSAAAPALWRLPATRARVFRKLRVASAFGAPTAKRGRAPPLGC